MQHHSPLIYRPLRNISSYAPRSRPANNGRMYAPGSYRAGFGRGLGGEFCLSHELNCRSSTGRRKAAFRASERANSRKNPKMFPFVSRLGGRFPQASVIISFVILPKPASLETCNPDVAKNRSGGLQNGYFRQTYDLCTSVQIGFDRGAYPALILSIGRAVA